MFVRVGLGLYKGVPCSDCFGHELDYSFSRSRHHLEVVRHLEVVPQDLCKLGLSFGAATPMEPNWATGYLLMQPLTFHYVQVSSAQSFPHDMIRD